jgi:hypothetical protein
VAPSEQLLREFHAKREAYLSAQRAFNEAVAALYGKAYPDFESVTRCSEEQTAAHDAYYAIVKQLTGNK